MKTFVTILAILSPDGYAQDVGAYSSAMACGDALIPVSAALPYGWGASCTVTKRLATSPRPKARDD